MKEIISLAYVLPPSIYLADKSISVNLVKLRKKLISYPIIYKLRFCFFGEMGTCIARGKSKYITIFKTCYNTANLCRILLLLLNRDSAHQAFVSCNNKFMIIFFLGRDDSNRSCHVEHLSSLES